MSKFWRVQRVLAGWLPVIFFTVMSAGCAKKIPLLGSPSPFRVDMLIRALPQLNEGDSRQGNPVIFFVYQLQSDVKFREVTSENFWREGEKILEKDLLTAKVEITLYPDQTQVLNLKVLPETKFLGFAANFHTPDAQRWRLILSVAAVRNKNVIIEVGRDFLNTTNR